MKNLRIRIKLLVTFMTIIVLFCATVAVAITGLRRNSDSYSDFYNVGYQVTNRIMNMRRGLQIIVKDLGLMTIQEDNAKCAEYQADMEKELELLQENGNWVFEHFQDNPEMLENFSESITKAVEMQATIIGLTATDMKAAQEMLLNEYQPLITESVDKRKCRCLLPGNKGNAKPVSCRAAWYGRYRFGDYPGSLCLSDQYHHQTAPRAGSFSRKDLRR